MKGSAPFADTFQMLKPLLLSMALAVAVSGSAFAGHHDGDHDRARAALQSGRAVPLRDILDKVAQDYPGDMLEVELEDEDDRLVYDVKLLTPDGTILRLVYDARTKELISAKGRGDRRARRE